MIVQLALAEIITDNVNGFLIPFKNRELFIQKLRKLTP